MQRRTLLERLTAIATVGALAGCLDEGTPDEGGDPNHSDEEENGTDDGVENGADDEENGGDDGDEDGGDDEESGGELQEERIETTDTDCADGGSAESAAEISFADGTVEITGSIGASDPCHEATLEDVTVDAGELTVGIGVESDDAEACQQCLGRLEYEATLEFDDPPESVTVVHEDDEGATTVAEADRGE